MAQRVFITAGAGGIGRVIAQAYATQGAQVYVCDQDAAAIAALDARITSACVDVTDEAALTVGCSPACRCSAVAMC